MVALIIIGDSKTSTKPHCGLRLDFEEGIFVLFQIVIMFSYEFHATAA